MKWIVRQIEKIKLWYRRRKVDRRIRKQAEAAHVWHRPEAMGGRALELYAWELCRLKRRSGETDKELRRRCMEAGMASEPREGGRENE